MKALIFGANGQDGYYLSQACRKRGIEVIGISRSGPWLRGDVASPEIVEELVKSGISKVNDRSSGNKAISIEERSIMMEKRAFYKLSIDAPVYNEEVYLESVIRKVVLQLLPGGLDRELIR